MRVTSGGSGENAKQRGQLALLAFFAAMIFAPTAYAISASPVLVNASPLPAAAFETPYTATLTASGGSGSYSFTATGLPTGLNLNRNTGVISGTPRQAGSFPITVTATDHTPPESRWTA